MRIGVCADIHGHVEPLRRVLDQMEERGVDERWCLGDLVGGGRDPIEVVRLARELDLCLLGNHDAWMLAGRGWPEDANKLRGRDALWLTSLKPLATRHGVQSWHGAPSQPLLKFFDANEAMKAMSELAPGSLGLVGHTHVPIAYVRARGRVFEINPDPGTTVFLDPDWAVVANPGAVAGGDDPSEPWWLELDPQARSLRWHSAAREAVRS